MNLTAVAGVVGYRTKWTANDSLLTSYDVNLSAYWPLGEATGATRYDLVGNYAASDHSSYGDVVYQDTGKYGNCAFFDKARGYYMVLDILKTAVDISSVIASKNWTISAWFKLLNLPVSSSDPMFTNATDSGGVVGSGLFLGFRNVSGTTRARVQLYNSGTATLNLTGASSISLSFWHHMFVNCTSSSLRCYIDNSAHATTASTINVGTGYDAHIGNSVENGLGVGMDGYVDELAIWNTALPNSYAGTLYNSGNGAFRRN